jgi:lysophospholipase L1-like esterase
VAFSPPASPARTSYRRGLAATNPDIVIMHLGTNDMWGGQTPVSTVLAAYTTLVDQMRANNPTMKIIVAQILPMGPPACTACTQAVINLNAAIPGWAADLTTSQSPIVVVDQWTGFNITTDTGDGVHPNDAGFRKMAARRLERRSGTRSHGHLRLPRLLDRHQRHARNDLHRLLITLV